MRLGTMLVLAVGVVVVLREVRDRRAPEEAADPVTVETDTHAMDAGGAPSPPGSSMRAEWQQRDALSRRRAEPDDAEQRARDEEQWRSQAERLRADVAAAEAWLRAAEAETAAAAPAAGGGYGVQCQPGRLVRSDGSLGPLTDPCASQATDPAQERYRAGQSGIEAARRELERARQALASLENEARRAGALPGWTR